MIVGDLRLRCRTTVFSGSLSTMIPTILPVYGRKSKYVRLYFRQQFDLRDDMRLDVVIDAQGGRESGVVDGEGHFIML